MTSRTRSPRITRLLACCLAVGLVVAACGDDDDGADDAAADTDAPAGTEASVESEAPAETDTPVETDAPAGTDAPVETEASAASGVLNVPADFPTIQEAVDAAVPGDLVLIAPGTYHEAVNVVTDEITIRGLDRNGVILDGEFELDNGIRVLGAKGVVIENMTAMNYAFNGFFWLEADGYRGSYLTAYRNGDYGVYGFDSVNGLLEHSYGAGSPDAGFYIGQCYPCNTVLDGVWGEHNGLGYSGTDSGGAMYVVNSQFNNNRSGIVPNSGSYELCYPERETTVVGNAVFSNSQADTPAIENALLAHGTGITPAGGVANVIERNLVYDHERVGIAIAPFPEGSPNDVVPPQDEWAKPCEENRQRELTTPDPSELLFEEFLVWEPYDNVVRDNVVRDSGQADIGYGAGVILESGDQSALADLGNCFSGNIFESSQPNNIEKLAPCDGKAKKKGWDDDPLDLVQLFTYEAPEPVDYEDAPLPEIPLLPGMDDPGNAPAESAVDGPPAVDTDSITVPEGPIFER